MVNTANPDEKKQGAPGRADGILGGAKAVDLKEAFVSIMGLFGKDVDLQYDYNCATTSAWPMPFATDAKQKLFMRPDPNNAGECEFTAEETPYSVFTEGDVKRCYIDAKPEN